MVFHSVPHKEKANINPAPKNSGYGLQVESSVKGIPASPVGDQVLVSWTEAILADAVQLKERISIDPEENPFLLRLQGRQLEQGTTV